MKGPAEGHTANYQQEAAPSQIPSHVSPLRVVPIAQGALRAPLSAGALTSWMREGRGHAANFPLAPSSLVLLK